MRKTTILVLSLTIILILCFSLTACNASEKDQYTEIELTLENVNTYLVFRSYYTNAEGRYLRHVESSKKCDAQFKGVVITYQINENATDQVELDWEGYSHITKYNSTSIGNNKGYPIVSVSGSVLIPN